MDRRVLKFLIRAVLGVAGGWVLDRFFLQTGNWFVILILAALVVVAAYSSEWWSSRKQNKK